MDKTLRNDLIEKGEQCLELLNQYKRASIDISMIQHITILESHFMVNECLEKGYILLGAVNTGSSIKYHLGYAPEILRARRIEQENLTRLENICKRLREYEEAYPLENN